MFYTNVIQEFHTQEITAKGEKQFGQSIHKSLFRRSNVKNMY